MAMKEAGSGAPYIRRQKIVGWGDYVVNKPGDYSSNRVCHEAVALVGGVAEQRDTGDFTCSVNVYLGGQVISSAA